MTFAAQYLREHLRLLALEIIFALIFGIVFYLYHLPLSAVLYPAILCTLLGTACLGSSMYRAYRKHKLLTELKAACAWKEGPWRSTMRKPTSK